MRVNLVALRAVKIFPDFQGFLSSNDLIKQEKSPRQGNKLMSLVLQIPMFGNPAFLGNNNVQKKIRSSRKRNQHHLVVPRMAFKCHALEFYFCRASKINYRAS